MVERDNSGLVRPRREIVADYGGCYVLYEEHDGYMRVFAYSRALGIHDLDTLQEIQEVEFHTCETQIGYFPTQRT
jgi:hypothetical protein